MPPRIDFCPSKTANLLNINNYINCYRNTKMFDLKVLIFNVLRILKYYFITI